MFFQIFLNKIFGGGATEICIEIPIFIEIHSGFYLPFIAKCNFLSKAKGGNWLEIKQVKISPL